jgi:hypothetical protein
MRPTEDRGPDPLQNLTEKELLLEIFRETRTIKRILIGVFVGVPLLWIVVAVAMIDTART